MNAIEFLIKEHNKVRKMLLDIADEKHHYETQKKQFERVSQELLRHEDMEHQIWYPHFKDKLPQTIKHLVTEEKGAEKAIHKLNTLKTETAWKEHFLKFSEDVEHHAHEEEHDLFPEVQKILSQKELEDIGLKMHVFKMKHVHSNVKH